MAHRGIYRAVYSSLFDDPDYQRLPSPARLLLLTLRQCADAGPAAIFRYYVEKLRCQTGLAQKVIERSLDDLEDGGWIAYRYPIVWVRNGLRYDPTMTLANPKHAAHIEKWLASLPKSEIGARFCKYYGLAYPFDTVSDRVSAPIHQEQEQYQEKEQEQEQEHRGRPLPAVLTDGQFLDQLRTNPAYRGLDLEAELAKMDAWLLTPRARGRKKTRQFVVNWLNKCDRPLRDNGHRPARTLGATPQTAGNADVLARALERERGQG